MCQFVGGAGGLWGLVTLLMVTRLDGRDTHAVRCVLGSKPMGRVDWCAY